LLIKLGHQKIIVREDTQPCSNLYLFRIIKQRLEYDNYKNKLT